MFFFFRYLKVFFYKMVKQFAVEGFENFKAKAEELAKVRKDSYYDWRIW